MRALGVQLRSLGLRTARRLVSVRRRFAPLDAEMLLSSMRRARRLLPQAAAMRLLAGVRPVLHLGPARFLRLLRDTHLFLL